MATSRKGETERFIDRYSRPAKKHLHEYVLPDVCTRWYDLGLELLDPEDENKLSAIETNYRKDGVQICCKEMFDEWLDYDDVSWDILVQAIRKIKLNHAASKIEKLFETPAATKGKKRNSADSNGKKKMRKTCNEDSDEQSVQSELYDSEPEMGDLNKIVIPRIQAEWENVAFALRYKIAMVKTIREKHREDPKKCCSGFLQDWLTSKNGNSPKTWRTLLNALKEVDELTSAVQEIEEELNK